MLDREHHDSRSHQSTDSHFREHFVPGVLAAGQTLEDPLLPGPLLRGVRLWPPWAGRGQATSCLRGAWLRPRWAGRGQVPSCLRGAQLRPPRAGDQEEGQASSAASAGPCPQVRPVRKWVWISQPLSRLLPTSVNRCGIKKTTTNKKDRGLRSPSLWSLGRFWGRVDGAVCSRSRSGCVDRAALFRGHCGQRPSAVSAFSSLFLRHGWEPHAVARCVGNRSASMAGLGPSAWPAASLGPPERPLLPGHLAVPWSFLEDGRAFPPPGRPARSAFRMPRAPQDSAPWGTTSSCGLTQPPLWPDVPCKQLCEPHLANGALARSPGCGQGRRRAAGPPERTVCGNPPSLAVSLSPAQRPLTAGAA